MTERNERASPLQNSITLTRTQIAEFRSLILAHFQEHGRDFPWRRTLETYAIMVSESMLQQTQAARVTEKYEAWMKRSHTVLFHYIVYSCRTRVRLGEASRFSECRHWTPIIP